MTTTSDITGNGISKRAGSAGAVSGDLAIQALNALPLPLLIVEEGGRIAAANMAAEVFFEMGASQMCRHTLAELTGFSSPMLSLLDDVLVRKASVNEYRVDIGLPRSGAERVVDLHAAPFGTDAQRIIITLQERTIADKIDRQMTHRGAARSVTALAAMLAHEIKNPLSGIRGAAQLLEGGLNDDDRALTRLICDETDRIVKLVDRMEIFTDGRPVERQPVNIHSVLNHVKQLANAGFARHIKFTETYDPSLPPVLADRDQLIQIFLNLVKNAAEAIGAKAIDGEIEFSTAFRPGVRIRGPGTGESVGLPLEIRVRDNGPGVNPDIAANLFDPFVSGKESGTGLGLALVAKLVGDHGGIIECESRPRRTIFKLLLPMAEGVVDDESGNADMP
ncbi:MAG: two-component sensor histidine kinase [Hyphomicrobiales bacterium]|nr:two-component sensor histidine kinase [Hyphomicrobiales bacterium]